MAYSDFTLKDVVRSFQLTLMEVPDLCAAAAEVAPSAVLQSLLPEYVPLALASGNVKARSELLVMPLLFEIRRQMQHRISLFSGTDFAVWPERGLNGICDFLLSHSPEQQFIQWPVGAIVAANNDNLKSGLGPCVVEMVAAQIFNDREGATLPFIFGVVTTGSVWWFLKLEGQTVYLDQKEYYLNQIAKVLGIFIHFLST